MAKGQDVSGYVGRCLREESLVIAGKELCTDPSRVHFKFRPQIGHADFNQDSIVWLEAPDHAISRFDHPPYGSSRSSYGSNQWFVSGTHPVEKADAIGFSNGNSEANILWIAIAHAIGQVSSLC